MNTQVPQPQHLMALMVGVFIIAVPALIQNTGVLNGNSKYKFMILNYSLPRAEELINEGVKIHTLRVDTAKRWKPGMKISHGYSFRSKGGYRCFKEDVCTKVQEALIVLVGDEILNITIGRGRLSEAEADLLIKNDGFTSRAGFINWFFPKNKRGERPRSQYQRPNRVATTLLCRSGGIGGQPFCPYSFAMLWRKPSRQS